MLVPAPSWAGPHEYYEQIGRHPTTAQRSPVTSSDGPTGHELYFMCDDLEATVGDLQAKGVEFTQGVSDERWGRLTRFRLPSGGEVGMYEPRHPLAIDL